jgi:hypothetical protein
MFCLSVQWGVAAMTPFLLRKTLGANDWQTFIATSSISGMYLLAIFWNEVYRRLSSGRYLLLLWMLAIVPLGAVALFKTPWPVLACILLSATGTSGIQPIVADILRSCYPPATRSRVFSVLKTIEQLVVMASALGIGIWLTRNHYAYRVFFPISAVIIGLGLLLLYRITREALFRERLWREPSLPLLRSIMLAWRSMADAMRRDPDFRQFETGYTIYGLGWMMCYALMPFLVVDFLRLTYEQVAWSTQSVQQLTIVLTLVPVGLLMERIGPIRLSGWTHVLLVIYPLGLLFVWDAWSLAVLTVLYGVGMTSMNLVWTIAPVTLAKDASQAPHYLAIHATLVSVRALLGQLSAVAYYHFTGQIRPPLAFAGVLFAVAAVIMFRLDRRRAGQPVRVAVPPPVAAAAP